MDFSPRTRKIPFVRLSAIPDWSGKNGRGRIIPDSHELSQSQWTAPLGLIIIGTKEAQFQNLGKVMVFSFQDAI